MSPRLLSRLFGLAVLLLWVLGLAMRLEGIGSSLWVDEFGTLWVIESGFRDVLGRCARAQGQTPLYYLVAWAAVGVFGESEQVLRAVSIGAATIATVLVGLAAGRLGGNRAGLVGATLFWLTPSVIATSTSVRPYALGYLFAALAIAGFVQACARQGRAGRAAFVIGIAGLWWTHFLLAPLAAGLVLAWLALPVLRAAYPARRFVQDVALVGLLVVPTVPHLLGLVGRRSGLAWAFSYSWSLLLPLAPFAVLASVGLVFVRRLAPRSPVHVGLTLAMLVSIAVHIGTLALATWLGAPLMVTRFLMIVLVPAAVLAAVLLAAAPVPVMGMACLGFLAWSASDLRHRHQVYGTFSGAGYQHWREAVEALEQDRARFPGSVVLYRSGFVEDDMTPFGRGAPHTRSPLRSPGRRAPSFDPVVLPFHWSNPALPDYLEREVSPRLASADVVYFIGPPFAEPAEGEYVDSLRRWVSERWPGMFRVEPLGSAQAMVLLRFVKQ